MFLTACICEYTHNYIHCINESRYFGTCEFSQLFYKLLQSFRSTKVNTFYVSYIHLLVTIYFSLLQLLKLCWLFSFASIFSCLMCFGEGEFPRNRYKFVIRFFVDFWRLHVGLDFIAEVTAGYMCLGVVICVAFVCEISVYECPCVVLRTRGN